MNKINIVKKPNLNTSKAADEVNDALLKQSDLQQQSVNQQISGEMKLNNVKSLKQTIHSNSSDLSIQKNVKNLYDAAEFDQVVQLIQSRQTQDKTLRQYLGLALFQLSQFNIAREVFESLLTFEDINKIDSPDVLTIILYLSQIHYERDYLVDRIKKLAEDIHKIYQNFQEPDQNYKEGLLVWLNAMIKIFDCVTINFVLPEKWEDIIKDLNDAKDKLSAKYYVELLILLSSVTSLKGDNQEAIKINERVLAINPNNFEATCNQGFFYSKISEPEKSLEFYYRARKLNSSNIINLINISVSFNLDKKYAEAMKIAQYVIDLQPKNDKGYLMKSSILHSEKKYQQSIDVLMEAKIKCEPTRYLLTQLFFYQQNNFQYAECLATANEALQIFPNPGDFNFIIGRLQYFQLRQYDKALAAFELSLNQPRFEVSTKLVYFGIALSTFKLGQPYKCARSFAIGFTESKNSPLIRSEIVDFIQTFNSLQRIPFKTFIYIANFFAWNSEFATLVAQYFARKDLPNIFIECSLKYTTAASVLAFQKQYFDILTINPTYVLWDLSIQ